MTEAKTIHIVPKTGPQTEIDLLALVKKYFFSKWYWYVLGAGIGFFIAHTQLKEVAPLHEIKSRILIKENKGVAASTEDLLVEQLYAARSKSMSKEIEILKSHSMIEEVVNTLHLNIGYLWPGYLDGRHRYGKFPIYFDTFIANSPAIYEKEFFIEPLDSLNFAFKTDTLIGTYQLNQTFSNEYGTFRLVAKAPIPLDKKNDLQVTFKNAAYVADNYIKKIKIGSGEHANMVDLKIEDQSPPRGIDFMNTLVDHYNTTTIKDKNEVAVTTLNFVDERLNKIVKDLNSIERKIERYKRQNHIVTEAGANASLLTNEVQKLTKKKKELSIKWEIFENMFLSIDTKNNDFQLLPTNLSHINANLMGLLDQYNEQVLYQQQLLKVGQPSNPKIISITEDIRSLRASIATTLDNYSNDVQREITSITIQLDQLTGRLQEIPAKERGLLETKRQLDIKENLYVYLLEKREEIALALIANGPNCKFIDRPRSSKFPVSPNPPIYYIGGIMTGIFLPFLIIIGRDVFKSTIESVAEIKSINPNIPIIGIINKNQSRSNPYQPMLKQGGYAIPISLMTPIIEWKNRLFNYTPKSAVVVNPERSDTITEDFFMARTNLNTPANDTTQVVLVTGAQHQVGKTFVAINLAMSFASTNKKTLLVDLDLRHPSITRELNLSKHAFGISHYLEQEQEIAPLIQKTSEEENLHIFTAGNIPSNVPRFLTDHRLIRLFEKLKEEYDVIIIDSPPVDVVADAFLINPLATNSIYVVRKDESKTSNLKQAMTFFDQKKLVNPSILFNDF